MSYSGTLLSAKKLGVLKQTSLTAFAEESNDGTPFAGLLKTFRRHRIIIVPYSVPIIIFVLLNGYHEKQIGRKKFRESMANWISLAIPPNSMGLSSEIQYDSAIVAMFWNSFRRHEYVLNDWISRTTIVSDPYSSRWPPPPRPPPPRPPPPRPPRRASGG
ncbi:hypothetical protein RB195_003535 [Necator americanus]|uniref:Bestrophin homolog n=1 Tax=Necator americanus TaxID=51031 RepID=A0ABR1DP10_NECAM